MRIKTFRSRRFCLLLFVAATVLFLFTVGCGGFKQNAVEGEKSIGVVIEGSHAGVFKPLLSKALEREVLTPQPEKHYELIFGNDDSLSRYSLWANVILVGALDSDDRVSERLKTMLKGESLEGVRQGQYTIFRKHDLWARGQTVVFLVASTRALLAEWMEKNGDELYRIFSDDRDERMLKKIYALMEQKSLADSIRKAHGWSFRIQHDYRIVSSKRSPNFIRLRRTLPDRFLSVAWRIGEPEEVSVDTFIAWRDSIGKHFSDPSRINPSYLKTGESTLSGRPALKIEGLWETYGTLGGGPFVAYLAYSGGTLYLLEGDIYAPDREKEHFLRQLNVILKTFTFPAE